MKAKDYRIHRSMGERIIRQIEGNSYVQLAIFVALGIAAGWLTAMVNAVKWGMTM